jgi:endonuclease III
MNGLQLSYLKIITRKGGKQCRGKDTILAMFLFLLVVLLGPCTLPPQSDRDKNKDEVYRRYEQAKDYAEDVKDKVTSSIEKGKGLYEEKKSAITKAVDAGKEAYEKEKERLAKE